jgi:glucosamine 6-phosphate synthetase-like amidotransferase/phosphosugar isomerase protein
MCGLVGWITSEKGSDAYDRRKFIDQALILDTVRGGDSTGVFVVSNFWKQDEKPWADWRKQTSGGHEFVITPEYKALFDAGKTNEYKFCVGHNRSATSGGVVLDAAHPFTEGPITLVHNGTVKKEYTTEVELANDSHGICWRLSKDPVEEVIKSLDGAFALIWHDARDDSLNFVRNSQRPLHMAKAKGNDTIYFASEAEMLYWLDHRLTLKLQDIVSMKPAHWLKFKGPKLMVPEVKPVELYSPKAQSQTKWDSSNWSGTGQSNAGSDKSTGKESVATLEGWYD